MNTFRERGWKWHQGEAQKTSAAYAKYYCLKILEANMTV